MKTSSLLLAGGMLLALANAALANTTTSLALVSSTTISSVNYNVYDLKITTDSNWTNQHLTLDLTQGSIYQDPLGNDTQPNPAFFGIAPSLQFDTFFTIPQGYPNTAGQGTATSIAGNVGPTSTHLFVDWNAPGGSTNAPGTYVVAQITLTSNAVGTFSGTAFDTQTAGVGQTFSGQITQASQVPEPASLAALSLGTLALLARKRRRA